MKRFLKRLVLMLLLLCGIGLGGASLWIYRRSHACLPQLDGTIRAPGLSARVEVWRDAHGVPHIRAQSIADALFAQGYVTAQDRLWQMDISRRHALGQLSEIFGSATLRSDVENRTLGLYLVAAQALADLDAGERGSLSAYTQGVNAFMESHRDRLPIEFQLLGYQPQPWSDLDCLAVSLNLSSALSQSWQADLMRERIIGKLGKELAADVFPDHSALDEPVAEVQALTKARPEAATATFCHPVAEEKRRPPEPVPPNPTLPGMGSNNWVVSGSHTKTGKPLLANDPHLEHAIPAVWYMIHLNAPGLDASGVSLPGLPFVVIGHNEHIAWGVTNTGTDVQDLYVESFNFQDPNKYLHNGAWIYAVVRDEVVKVHNEDDDHFRIKVTRHGPIISHDGDRDLALRWTLFEPHSLRMPFGRINQASDWRTFTAALHDFGVPMLNFVYADGKGNIGFYAPGLVPIRRRGNGSTPAPGSIDDYDWTGFVPFDDLPHAFNPASGILATANGRIVPDEYPYFISAKWEAPYRTARIFHLLRTGSSFTGGDMLRIQTDVLSLEDEWLARQLLAAGARHPPEGSDARYALGVLKGWDGRASAGSVPTLICEAARAALLTRILNPKLGNDSSAYQWAMSTTFLQNVVEQNLNRWLPPGDADFSVTLIESLEDGVRQIPGMVHSQSREAWKWGDAIPLTFHHLLSRGVPLLGRWLDVGPFPQAGTGTTVKQTTPSVGPSMRMVVDLSDFDQSMHDITLGESGQAFSPYYKDQFDAWYTGQSIPMLFSDASVEKAAVHKLVLEPDH